MANPFKDALIEYTDKAIADKKLEILNALKTNWAKDSLAALPRNAGIGALIGAGINGTRGAIKGWRDAAAKTTIKPRNLWIPEERIKASLEDKVWGAMTGGTRAALRWAGIGAGVGALSAPLSPVVSAATKYYTTPRKIQGITDRALADAKEFLTLDRDLSRAHWRGQYSDSLTKDIVDDLSSRVNKAFYENYSRQIANPVKNLAVMSRIQDVLNTPKSEIDKLDLMTQMSDASWMRGLSDYYKQKYYPTPKAVLNSHGSPLKDLQKGIERELAVVKSYI